MTKSLSDVIAALYRPSVASSDFDLNPEIQLPDNRLLRPAAVLIAIQRRNDGDVLYLTKRASHLKHHPGQIAFPGGKVDVTDTDATAAAIREADEEIALPPANLRVLGQLTSHETVTGFQVCPIVAEVTQTFVPRVDPNEVDEVFTVPLDHILTPDNFRVEQRRWRGSLRKYYVVPYGPYYIWGATARMLFGLAQQVTAP
jgi:8-oxo-dGTP pyrophosphatase MutT (NUDIX family)